VHLDIFEIIFPMFEFELKGDMDELLKMERELVIYLGFTEDRMKEVDYRECADKYGVEELENEHEEKLCEEHGEVVFLKNFPLHTSPFWNMKLYDNDKTTSKKIDVLMCGMETIGSAQRSTSKEDMKDQFYNISEKKYSEKLFNLFSQERVEKELNEFLDFDFFDRAGGGIGLTRLIRAMKICDLMK
jgi:aspartyl/asparaginyl-tRNA synthetase